MASVMETYSACPLCPPRAPEHDRMDYGAGTAVQSAAAILLAECAASDEQVEAICQALGRVR